METSTQPDLPPAIESKISSASYDNAAWHTDFCKQDTSATSCKIFQNSIPMSNSIVPTY